ncbi:MAG: hypothetical protein ACTSV6_03160 [Candidatus Heimdallarchaeota archaeon]
MYNRFGAFKHFDCMVISSHVKKMKPSEDIFNELMGRCSVRPSYCIYRRWSRQDRHREKAWISR